MVLLNLLDGVIYILTKLKHFICIFSVLEDSYVIGSGDVFGDTP